MEHGTSAAMIGLWGVVIGALVSLVGTVVIPWLRDTVDRKRSERERLTTERRDLTLGALAALLEMRQRPIGDHERGAAQARFGARVNELTVRLTEAEQPVLDVLMLMLAMVQEPRKDTSNMVGESMRALTLWARGDVATGDLISVVERKAGVKLAEDRQTAKRFAPPSP